MRFECVIGKMAPGIALVAGLVATQACAQSAWRPEKAVELIVTTAPGGSNDQVARLVQKIVQDAKLVPTPLVVINKVGGNQTIAMAYLAQYPADPHFLLLANPTLFGSHIAGITPLHYTDFTPIAQLVSEHTVFTVRADSPLRTVRELFDRVRADPDSIAFGLAARGGPSHLALSAAAKSAGIDARKLKTVIFKTSTESMTAMVGGHLQAVASTISSALGQVSAGNARILGIVSAQRVGGTLAEVPTLREQGIEVSVASWRTVFGARGIAPGPVAYWEEVLSRAVSADDWKKAVATNHWASQFLRGRELARHLEESYGVTRSVMADLGLAK
jgi:putative tricarboxylic transport membrane protein